MTKRNKILKRSDSNISAGAVEKHAGGRPTKYDPAFCDKVLELGAKGYTKEQISVELKLSKQTVYNWCDEHVEFLDAINEAVFLAQAFMEDVALDALSKPPKDFNTTLWSKIVSCRFPHVYRDTVRSEHSGIEGKPIAVASALPITGENLSQWYKQIMDG